MDVSPELLHQPKTKKDWGEGNEERGAEERRRAESRQKMKWRDVKSRRMKSSVMKSRTDGREKQHSITESLHSFSVSGRICGRLSRSLVLKYIYYICIW